MSLLGIYFSKADLKAIATACSEAEKNTSGEIRVSVFSKTPTQFKDKDIMEIALDEFFRLGMDKTHDRTGILLLILLDRRKFQILGDEGIHTKIDQSVWDEVAESLSQDFKQHNYKTGVMNVVTKMGAILSEHFPRKNDDVNELTDEVSVR
ncbi:MAG: TPM domain-containing protein [Candidatus Marinimicrobia bacterium]|nr:TPM domain-containing protein [Candidatus Neomarinimicrobiota bacterium]